MRTSGIKTLEGWFLPVLLVSLVATVEAHGFAVPKGNAAVVLLASRAHAQPAGRHVDPLARALELVRSDLVMGKFLTESNVRDIFDLGGKGVVDGHWYYEVMPNGKRRKSDLVTFKAGGAIGDYVSVARLELLNGDRVVRIELSMVEDKCHAVTPVVNALALEIIPPSGPLEDKSFKRFAGEYASGDITVDASAMRGQECIQGITVVSPLHRAKAQKTPKTVLGSLTLF